jgi:hypothetical protein
LEKKKTSERNNKKKKKTWEENYGIEWEKKDVGKKFRKIIL